MILVHKRARKVPFMLMASVLVVVLTLGSVAPSVLAQTPGAAQAGQPSGVSVIGEGIVAVPPTTAVAILGVEIFNDSLATAQAEAAERMATVIAFLQSRGIAESDIQTVSFSIDPNYAPGIEFGQTVSGYRVQNLVQVRTGDLEGLGTLLDEALANGANRFDGVHFESEDQSAAMDEARAAAVADARVRAERLAQLTGLTLGQPVYVEDLGTSPLPYFEVRKEAAANVTTPIQPGEIQVRASVRVIWAVQ